MVETKRRMPEKSAEASETTGKPTSWWDKRTKNEKILAGVGACCLGILLFIIVAGLISPDQPSRNVEEPELEKPKEVFNADSVKSIIGGGSEIKNIEVNNGAVTIYYDLGFVWDEDDIILKTSQDSITYMEKLFKDNRVKSVTVVSMGIFTDQYGNDNDEEAMRITIKKETANKINWEGVEGRLASDTAHLLKISDSYSINPSVWNKLTFYVPISK